MPVCRMADRGPVAARQIRPTPSRRLSGHLGTTIALADDQQNSPFPSRLLTGLQCANCLSGFSLGSQLAPFYASPSLALLMSYHLTEAANFAPSTLAMLSTYIAQILVEARFPFGLPLL